MLEKYFEKFIQSDVGDSLLKDIPQNRKEMVTEKLFTSFGCGAQAGMEILIMSYLDEMSREEKQVIFEYLQEQLQPPDHGVKRHL